MTQLHIEEISFYAFMKMNIYLNLLQMNLNLLQMKYKHFHTMKLFIDDIGTINDGVAVGGGGDKHQ